MCLRCLETNRGQTPKRPGSDPARGQTAKRPGRDPALIAAMLAIALSLTACNREARLFRQPATTASPPPASRVAEVQNGASTSKHEHQGPYDGNAWSVAQGKRLYVWFNCNGCHAMGGGGMGPS